MIGASIALLAALGYAMGNILIRKGVRTNDDDNGVLASLVVNVVVMTPAVLVLAAVVRLPPISPAGFAWFAAGGLLANFFGRSFLFAAIRHIGAARAGSIAQLQPVFAIVVALAFFGERITPKQAVGTAVALAGLALFSVPSLRPPATRMPAARGSGPRAMATRRAIDGPIRGKRGGTSMLGILLAILAAAGFGIGYVARKQGLLLIPNALLGATIASWIGLCIHLAVTRLRKVSDRAAGSAAFRTYFLLSGMAVTIGQLSVFVALSRISVSSVAVILSLQGVLTVLLGAWLLPRTEAVTARVAVAAIVIFAGAALLATDA